MGVLIFVFVAIVLFSIILATYKAAPEKKTEAVPRRYVLKQKYASSIKCKYCKHFNPRTNRCHLYNDFDSSMDRGNDAPYYKESNPENKCTKFTLPAMDAMAYGRDKNGEPYRRKDGSYIVELSDALE